MIDFGAVRGNAPASEAVAAANNGGGSFSHTEGSAALQERAPLNGGVIFP